MDFVAKRIEQVQLLGSPEGLHDSRPPIPIILRRDLPMQRAYAFKVHLERASWRAIAVVFCQVQNKAIAGDLHVKRRIVVESMFPIEVKTEIVEIKLAGLFHGKDAQDGDDSAGTLNHKVYRSNSSRAVLRSVLSSRYFTMTGA